MLKCESCGCPYVTNAPDGDIRFVMPPSDKTENRRLRTLLGRCYKWVSQRSIFSEEVKALLTDLEKEGLGGKEGE